MDKRGRAGSSVTPYPRIGPASIIACPRHELAVALDADGRIVSSCPACVRVAAAAEAKLDAAVTARLAGAEAWSTSA